MSDTAATPPASPEPAQESARVEASSEPRSHVSVAARRSPLLDRPGAVEADPPDAGVAAHYGSIGPEQRALIEGRAVVDLSHRDVITVTGPDRLTWLHSLTSQHLTALAPHQPTEVLLLTPQGRIEHHLHAVDDGETFWAHVEPGSGAPLVTFLDRMRFMMRVEVAQVDDAWAVIGRAEQDEPTWSLIPRHELSDQGELAGIWAWEAIRIAAHRPRFGLDTDERSIPHEVDLIGRAVHLDKGCYRGQETVARVHTLGRPPRRLVMLHLDGSAEHLPPHGSDVTTEDGSVIGQVGSSARHHELGPIALAVIKRSVAVDAALLADGVAAAQEVVVDPDVGLHVRPELRR